jgi:hypothetical protein
MFVAWTMRPRIPQRTLYGQRVCKKCYPQTFSKETTQGEDDYHIYRQRNDGQTFQKNPDGFAYDNQWVVPHNPYLTKDV